MNNIINVKREYKFLFSFLGHMIFWLILAKAEKESKFYDVHIFL